MLHGEQAILKIMPAPTSIGPPRSNIDTKQHNKIAHWRDIDTKKHNKIAHWGDIDTEWRRIEVLGLP